MTQKAPFWGKIDGVSSIFKQALIGSVLPRVLFDAGPGAPSEAGRSVRPSLPGLQYFRGVGGRYPVLHQNLRRGHSPRIPQNAPPQQQLPTHPPQTAQTHKINPKRLSVYRISPDGQPLPFTLNHLLPQPIQKTTQLSAAASDTSRPNNAHPQQPLPTHPPQTAQTHKINPKRLSPCHISQQASISLLP